jgi:hypothetical protein
MSEAVPGVVGPGNVAVFDMYRQQVDLTNTIITATPREAAPAWWPTDLVGDWRLDNILEVSSTRPVPRPLQNTHCHLGLLPGGCGVRSTPSAWATQFARLSRPRSTAVQYINAIDSTGLPWLRTPSSVLTQAWSTVMPRVSQRGGHMKLNETARGGSILIAGALCHAFPRLKGGSCANRHMEHGRPRSWRR